MLFHLIRLLVVELRKMGTHLILILILICTVGMSVPWMCLTNQRDLRS